jgi:hypothetical protein
MLPGRNAYIPGFISRALDYSIATYYGTEPPSRRRYSVAEPGLSSSVPYNDFVYLDAAAIIASKTNPQSKLVWTTAFQIPSLDKVGNPYTATGLSAGAVLSDEIQAEMLDGAAYTAAFFPVATHTVDAILASPATNTKTHTVDAVVYLAPTYLTVALSDSSANSLTTSTASANGLTITDSVFS